MTTILHVTECYSAGVRKAIDTIVELMPDDEHHLLWTGTDVPDPDQGFASTTKFPDGLVGRLTATRKVVARLEPAIVHAHSSWAGVYSRVLPVSAPIVYEPHCYKFDDVDANPLARRVFRLAEQILTRRSVATVVLSPHEDALAKSLNPTRPRHFLPNVPTVVPDGPAPDHHEPRPGEAVVMIGRLFAQKGPDFFLAVAEEVRRRRPGTPFTWIGDGETQWEEALSAAGITVTGWFDKPGLRAALADIGVYFHTARYEGFPLSVLDAAAFGLPILARAIPAFEGTPLVTAGTIEEASNALIEMLDGRPARTEAIRGGELLLESMNITKHVESLRDLYSTYSTESSYR